MTKPIRFLISMVKRPAPLSWRCRWGWHSWKYEMELVSPEFTNGDVELLFKALKAYEMEASGDILGKVFMERMVSPHSSAKDISDRLAAEVSNKVRKREEETIFLKGKLLRLKNYLAEHPEEVTTETKGTYEQ